MPRGDRLGQLVRTALIMGAMTALIAALGMVPMAKAVGGFLIAPIVSGLLGILVWREPPTAARLAGSAISFVGRRDAAAARGRARARLPASRCSAARCSAPTSRRPAAPATRPTRSRRWRCSRCSARRCSRPSRSPAACRRRRRRSSLGALALGALSAACHFLTVAAYQRAEATLLAPFLYFNLLTAMAVGLPLVRRDARAWRASPASLAIATGGLVTLIDPARVALPRRRERASRFA